MGEAVDDGGVVSVSAGPAVDGAFAECLAGGEDGTVVWRERRVREDPAGDTAVLGDRHSAEVGLPLEVVVER